MDGPSFRAYVEQASTGDIVFNRRTHNILVVREAIETMGTKLRLPPTLVPEPHRAVTFSKLNAALRYRTHVNALLSASS